MSTTQSITQSNGVTWNEVNKLVKEADGYRKVLSENANNSSSEVAVAAKTRLANLESSEFSRIINDPSILVTEKFAMLRKLAGGSLSEAQNQNISLLFQEFSQAMTMLTNIVKMSHETMMSAIRNMRV